MHAYAQALALNFEVNQNGWNTDGIHRQITLPAAQRKPVGIKGGDVIGSHNGQWLLIARFFLIAQ